jgi:hypothetical protein
VSRDVSDVQQLLADADAQVAQGHVDGKNPPPVVRFGAFVEPAFDDHEQTEGGNAAQKPQGSPEQGREIQSVKQGGGGRNGGENGEGPDMSDPLDQPMAKEGPGQQAREIAGQDDTGGGG